MSVWWKGDGEGRRSRSREGWTWITRPVRLERIGLLVIAACGAIAIVANGGPWAAYGLGFGALAAIILWRHW